MPGTNITRDEAAGRAALLRVDRAEVCLDLTGGAEAPTFPSTTRLWFSTDEPGASTWVDLVAPAVGRVVLNGIELDPAEAFDGFRIALPALGSVNELLVEADCAYMRTGEGLHRFVDPVDKEVYLYSQFEVADARRVYACFDQPDLKALTRPRASSLLATGPSCPTPPRRSPTTSARASRAGGSRPRSACRPTSRPSVAGRVRRRHRLLHRPVRHLSARRVLPALAGRAPRRRRHPAAHPAGLRVLRERLRRPRTRSASTTRCSCPSSTPGRWRTPAASRSTRTTCSAARSPTPPTSGRANTILHEMAHMWFGDLVTMRWWDDLWLNESFAEWAAYHASVQATRFTEAWTTFHEPAQGVGLPTGPAALDAPDRRRHGRPRGRRGELRRHHLRQGRLRPAPAGRLGRRGGLLRRAARLLRRSTPGATRRSPTCSPTSRRPAAAT